MISFEEKYAKISEEFLKISKRFREIKKENKLSKKQKKEIEKNLRIMSYWLLLHNPQNKNNQTILQGRIELCLSNFKKFNARS